MSHIQPLGWGRRGGRSRYGKSQNRATRREKGKESEVEQREEAGRAGDTMTRMDTTNQYDTRKIQTYNSKTDEDSSLDEFDCPAPFNNSASQGFMWIKHLSSETWLCSQTLVFFMGDFLKVNQHLQRHCCSFLVYFNNCHVRAVALPILRTNCRSVESWWAMIDMRADEYGKGCFNSLPEGKVVMNWHWVTRQYIDEYLDLD